MARFVRFEGCPKCGSRDNVGVYDDGSKWCFGCRYYAKPSATSFVPKGPTSVDGPNQHGTPLLRSVGRDPLPHRVVQWLRSFSLTVPDALARGAGWNAERQLLTFPYYDKDGALVCVQGRNFGDSGPKYFNRGSTQETVALIRKDPTSNGLVITEDMLSAIKVARQVSAWPALGTQFQLHKLLYAQKQGYQKIFVWLDRDKWKEGRDICERAQWLGLSARAVYSELDPKCYSDEEIMVYLK